uniref:Uncharacterized protein n=1 Tax=Salix viminalis TaxID=40686 RepID=A0A6N2L017_SALVM
MKDNELMDGSHFSNGAAPRPYSGTSTLALVAHVSAFSLGLVYGSAKLKYLQLTKLSIAVDFT